MPREPGEGYSLRDPERAHSCEPECTRMVHMHRKMSCFGAHWAFYNTPPMDDLKKKARERGEKLKLPYAGALLPSEAHALMQIGRAHV